MISWSIERIRYGGQVSKISQVTGDAGGFEYRKIPEIDAVE